MQKYKETIQDTEINQRQVKDREQTKNKSSKVKPKFPKRLNKGRDKGDGVDLTAGGSGVSVVEFVEKATSSDVCEGFLSVVNLYHLRGPCISSNQLFTPCITVVFLELPLSLYALFWTKQVSPLVPLNRRPHP